MIKKKPVQRSKAKKRTSRSKKPASSRKTKKTVKSKKQHNSSIVVSDLSERRRLAQQRQKRFKPKESIHNTGSHDQPRKSSSPSQSRPQSAVILAFLIMLRLIIFGIGLGAIAGTTLALVYPETENFEEIFKNWEFT